MTNQRPALFTSLLRGFCSRCPYCGKGRMFGKFLKVNDQCTACQEELHHHRADDMPAYFVITIVSHIIIPIVVLVALRYDFPGWVHLVLWGPICLGLCLLLLQPVKGTIVALQWALEMHGFARASE